ncbi:hypothetical protein D3C77_427900 [compost metagenome]
METFKVAGLMMAMGIKMPTIRDVPIHSEKDYDTAQFFYQRLKPFTFKSTNERVRVIYVGFYRATLEILK